MNSIIKKDNFIHYILSLLFVLFFIFLIPCDVNAANLTATSGTCGENVSWTFNPNSEELVISGTGNMTDYNSSNKSPFYGVTNINSVKINNGVTSIGDYAFYNTSFLYNIEIPTSVTTIGAAAFTSTSLLEINIPASVTNIANSAFSSGNRKTNNITVDPNNPVYDSRNNCNALIETATNTLLFGCKNTIIPNSVTSIGDYAFASNYNLSSIVIPGSVKKIGKDAFHCCYELEAVTISEGVENIDKYAFDHCYKITSITIPSSVESIGDYAFEGCSGLTSVTLSNGIKSIGNSAFKDCTSLTSITIPNSVTSIGLGVFSGSNDININVSSNNPVYDSRNNCNGIIETATNTLIIGNGKTQIPNSVTSIGEKAFYNCTSLTSITIPSSIECIDKGAFLSCTALESVTIPNSQIKIAKSSFEKTKLFNSLEFDSNGCKIYNNILFDCDKSKANITIPNNVVNYVYNLFSSSTYSNLTTLTLSNKIKKIWDESFCGCPKLESITIPSGIESIGNKAFYNRSSLISITIPNSVTSIGDSAFYCCKSLTSITIPNSVTSIGDRAFYCCESVTSITIPGGVESIGDYAFYYCLDKKYNQTTGYIITNGEIVMGSAYASAYNLSNYTVGQEIKVQRNINDTEFITVDDVSNKTYNGSAFTPSVTVKDENITLTKDTDYTVSYSNNTNAGIATITITGKGKFGGSRTKTFTINKANITPSVSISNWTYGNTASNPSVLGNNGNGTVTYTYTGTVNGGTSNGYNSTTKPTNAGSYKVTASVAASNNYNGGSCEKTFTINRADISPSITISDWIYGSTASNPSVSGNNGSGTVTYTYKGTVNGGANNGYNSSTKPTNAGSYTVTASIPQTNNYNGSSCNKTFTINRADINPTVSLTGWVYNKTPNNPSVVGNTGNGAVTYTYTVKDANNYSDNKPINAGNYTVKAAIAQTNNYNGAQCVTNFTIEKDNVSLSVSLEDWIYEQNPNVPVTLGIMENAAITYTYKSAEAADSEYSTDIPQNAGEYTIKATSAATSNYNEGYSTNTFTILKANITPTVSLTGWTYNDDANTPTVSGNSGNGAVSYSYTIKNADDYKTTVPENAGNYTLKCVISETSNYNGATCYCDFSITKASLDLTIDLDDWVYNTTPSIPQTTGNNGNGEESIEYKTLDAEDDEYSEEIPVNAGNYMVRYSVAETNNYNSGLITNTFKIEKANLDLSISIEDWIYKENANTPVKSGNISNGEESITYKEKTADTYGEEVPTNAGTYIIKYFVAETANYNEAETTYEFKIKKAQPNLKVSLENWVYSFPSPNPVKSGNLENGAEIIEYKVKGAEDDTYDETKPYDAGEYTIRYTVLETANYNECSTTNDFVIKKKEPVISVSIQNWTYGENPKTPVITNNIENGTVTYGYKLLGAENYSDEVPVNAGKYTIKAIINETNNYTAKTLFSNFIIYKADIHPEISINDWTYGEDAKQPILSGNLGNGKEKIEYKLKTQNDADYNTQIPVNAGEYTAHYLIEESDNYNSGESTCDFNIDKAPIAAVINVKDKITYNEKYDVTATIKNTNNNEEIKDINNIVFTYKKKTEEEYTNNKPINVGIYNVKVDVAESNNYLTTSSTSSFEIIKADINPILVLNDWTYNDKDIPTPQVTGCFEDNNIEYAYKTKDAYDDTYHEEVPVNAGEYTVRAIISDSDNYNGKTITSNFKINKANPQLSLNIKDWAYKENPNAPTLSGNIENAKCIYSYKLKTADDATYNENIPVDAGKYTIRANTEETTNYNSASVTKDFEILGIINNAPSIAVNDKYMVSIKAGEIKNDTLDYIEYKLNDGDWTKYTDSFPVYKQYNIKARQIAKRSQIISEQADVSGEEKPSGITAEYNGDNLFLGDKVSLEDIDVTVHYFNSQDEMTNDFYFDNDTIKAVGDNTITIRFKEYSDNVTVVGKRQTVIFKNRLLYADGTPMKNKKVCFIGENGEIYWAITDEDGYYTIENFKTGKYTFKVYDGDTVICDKEIIVDGLSETEDVVGETTTSIYSTATLSGIFKYSDSSFVSNAEIVLIDKKTQKEVAKTSVDDKGYYSFENIPFGDYIIKVYVNNVLISSEDVTVDGKTSSITYNKLFKNGVMKLQNRLTYADGSPMSNIEVKLYNKKGELIAIVKTDENGYYEFPDIPIGEYIIKAYKDDIEIYKADITITGEDVIFSGNQKENDTIDNTPINQQNEDSNNNIPETSDRNVNNNQTDDSNSVDLPEQPTLSEFNSTNKKTFKQTLNSYKPKIKKVKVINKNKIKITIKNITGPITNYKEIKNIKYQIQLADNKKMKKSKKYVTKNTKYTIKKKNLAKKTYYLRVRLVYQEKGSIKRCSKWSKIKSIKNK